MTPDFVRSYSYYEWGHCLHFLQLGYMMEFDDHARISIANPASSMCQSILGANE